MNTTSFPRASQLVYQELGDPSAPPAIVVHGMAECGDEVLPVAQALSNKYRVLIPDLPGHGASPGDLREISIAKLATAIADFCGSLAIDHAVFVGHSLGGVIVTELAAEHSDLVSRAVLLDPGMAFPEETKVNLARLYESLTDDNFETTLFQILPPILFDEKDDRELVDRVMAGMVEIGVESFVAMGQSIIAFDGLSTISRVNIPLLCVVNSQPLIDISAVGERVPHFSVVEVENVSHQGLVHHPETHAAVADFMK